MSKDLSRNSSKSCNFFNNTFMVLARCLVPTVNPKPKQWGILQIYFYHQDLSLEERLILCSPSFIRTKEQTITRTTLLINITLLNQGIIRPFPFSPPHFTIGLIYFLTYEGQALAQLCKRKQKAKEDKHGKMRTGEKRSDLPQKTLNWNLSLSLDPFISGAVSDYSIHVT